MFNFIRKLFISEKIEEKISNDISDELDNDKLITFYQNKTKNYIWNDYIKLNKYEKLFAYSLKDINDIEIINAVRNAYFNPKDYNNKTALSKEIKAKIKSLKMFLKDVHSLQTNNSMILHHLIRFPQIIDLPLSQYIRIVSSRLDTSPEIEMQLDNFVFHRDNKELYKFLPPNHPKDKSHVMCIRKKDFARYSISKVSTNFESKHQHEDYDFCTSQYLLDLYKNQM